ncbi:MAG: hypothetical protein NC211_06030 [Alistipes senegalensis]|nr:hypothetical protein [Oxalobacter formigenes]MCM1281371.1 hypothetical protein [Alistipes senegalensis]
MASEEKQENAPSGNKAVKPFTAPPEGKATDTNVFSSKPGWKGKRGRMLQEAGSALLSEPGSDEVKLARFLDREKEKGKSSSEG